MELYVVSAGRSFTVDAHCVIADGLGEILFASFAGTATAVDAVCSSITTGKDLNLLEKEKPPVDLKGGSGYTFTQVKLNEVITHGVIISKKAVYIEKTEGKAIVAPDGDVRKAVGEHYSSQFALPREWVMLYYDMIPDKDVYTVIMNPIYPELMKNLHIQEMIRKTVGNLLLTESCKIVNIPKDYYDEKFILDQIDQRLKDGRLKIPEISPFEPKGLFDPSWNWTEYMMRNAHIFVEKLKNIRPRHVPGKDPLSPWIAKQKRIPFPAQAHSAQGIINTLREQGNCFDVGDMGTGKSATSLTVAHVMHHEDGVKNVLIMAPSITIPKWVAEEINVQLPYATTRIVKSTEDALQYIQEVKAGKHREGLNFVLVSTDRAKLGPDPWCTAIWKRVKGSKNTWAWHCPECQEPIIYTDKDESGMTTDILAGWNTFVHADDEDLGPTEPYRKRHPNGVPVDMAVKWNKKMNNCPNCKAKLWRPAVKLRGETRNKPRYFISVLFKRHLKKWFDLGIFDEIQQMKAADSGRGDAFAQLVKASKRVLCLTGTLVNGKSSSIKEILWRIAPEELLKEGFNHKSGTVTWAQRFGVVKKIIETTGEDEGIVTRRKKVERQPTEEPGIAPRMTAQFILHRAVFRELSDLGLPLPELKEIPMFIDFDKEHGSLYRSFHSRLHDVCAAAAMKGAKGAFAKFIPATINYADVPHLGASVKIGKEIYEAPALPRDYYHAKERTLVELVKRELSEDRGVMIYCNYTDTYGVDVRVKEVLAAHGIEANILSSAVSPEKRVDWLEAQKIKGVKVLIANMRLVEVGLNIINYPTIVFYQMNYDINTVRQSSRRAWRIGQTKECRIYYMVYNQSQQVAQFENIMLKRGHALIVEGRLDRSELSKYSKDAHSSLAKSIAECIADSDMADTWKKIAAKDIDEKIVMVSEDKFQEALRKAMKELTEETKRLCGAIEESKEEKTIELSKPSPFGPAETSPFEPIKDGGSVLTGLWGAVEAPKKPIKKSEKKRKKTEPAEQLSLFDMMLM